MYLYARFVYRILHHKWWVLLYGLKIGGIPLRRLIVHDFSKFHRAEFFPRFKRQILCTLKDGDLEWELAKDYHHRHNAHHWQYWVRSGVALPMPEAFVREMVADWFAAKKTYNDTVPGWLREEFPKMNLHIETVSCMIKVLSEQKVPLKEWFRPKKQAA